MTLLYTYNPIYSSTIIKANVYYKRSAKCTKLPRVLYVFGRINSSMYLIDIIIVTISFSTLYKLFREFYKQSELEAVVLEVLSVCVSTVT